MHIHCQDKFGLPQCNLQTEWVWWATAWLSCLREYPTAFWRQGNSFGEQWLYCQSFPPCYKQKRVNYSSFPSKHPWLKYSFIFMIIHSLGGFVFDCCYFFCFAFCLRVSCNLTLELLVLLPPSPPRAKITGIHYHTLLIDSFNRQDWVPAVSSLCSDGGKKKDLVSNWWQHDFFVGGVQRIPAQRQPLYTKP